MFDMDSFWGKIGGYLHAYIKEHNIVNVFRRNFHRIDKDAFRSSQPTTYQLRRYAKKYGIKTIINTRGYKEGSPLKYLEERTCKELGIEIVYFKVYSRAMPTFKILQDAKNMFENIEYPVLIHCKSGADRSSFISALYMHFKLGKGVEESMKSQLSFIPYGHIKNSKAGCVDHFLSEYLKFAKSNPEVSLLEWSEKYVDEEKLKDSFTPLFCFDIFVDKILRRE